MRTATPAPRATAPRRRGRLTRRVFWDLAIYMVGMGLAVGLVFPPFATLLGVPTRYATRPAFVAACLAAGFLVGAFSFALCRWLVGGQLAVLSRHLRQVAEGVARASRTGDFTGATTDRIAVGSDDQLGETASAFNSLLDALEDGEHFRSLVRNASHVITVIDPEGTIAYVTPSVTRGLGHEPAALVGSSLFDMVHPDDAPAVRDHLAAIVAGVAQPVSVGCRMRHLDGSWRRVETSTANLLADPSVGGLVLTTRDVGERHALEEQLRDQAHRDPLTGLPNRALFLERLERAERERALTGVPVAVLFIDLDDLKTLNDTVGHEAGDTVLKAIAERLTASVRAGDVVARLSGDEFAALLVGADSEDDAPAVASRIVAAVREPVRVHGRAVRPGVSVGIATAGTCEASDVGLLRAADTAMYLAKSAGKGRAEVFTSGHHAAQLDQDRLRADLHGAVEGGQLVLHYQPLVDLRSGTTTGHEALLRWQHPQRGLVPPAQFIALAEDSGLIVPIGRWVLAEAARQAAAWAPLRMSVNVSVRQFQHSDVVADVVEALRVSGLDPHLLTLEVTESLFVADLAATARTLGELKELGVRLALDDFGTGYSSLSHLRRFPVDVLKIDKSFVDGVVTSAQDRAVVGTIVELARILGLEVVAEGLESAEQVEVLVALQCGLGQGYHFARPLPALEAGETLAVLAGVR